MYRMNLVNPVSSCNPVLISLRNQLRVSDKNTPNFLVDSNFRVSFLACYLQNLKSQIRDITIKEGT